MDNKKKMALVSLILAIFLIGFISYYYLYIGFNGIKTDDGLDQAQLARQISQGKGLTTKVIRPLALWDYQEKNKKDVKFSEFPDVSNAPLNPVVNSFFLWATKSFWSFEPIKDKSKRSLTNHIFKADRIIIITSMLFLVASFVIYFFLIKKIFDKTIAVFTTFCLILSLVLWEQTQSGLAHSLIQLIFACTCYVTYNFIEAIVQDRKIGMLAILCGFLYGLMILANYLMLFPFIGLLIFFIINLKERKALVILIAIITLITTSYTFYRNHKISGNILGTMPYLISVGLKNGDERAILAKYGKENTNVVRDGFLRLICHNATNQFNDFSKFYSLNVAIPAFLLAMFHFFKNPSINLIRYAVLLQWVFAVLGMSIFGVYKGELDKFQIHSLFVPICTAFGYAFALTLWRRVQNWQHKTWLANLPIIALLFISSIPLILKISFRFNILLRLPYVVEIQETHPRSANTMKLLFKNDEETIMSDIPASVAWYTGQPAIWLPHNFDSMDKILAYSNKVKSPIIGFSLSRKTLNHNFLNLMVDSNYKDWWNVINDVIVRNKIPGYLPYKFVAKLDAAYYAFVDSSSRISELKK